MHLVQARLEWREERNTNLEAKKGLNKASEAVLPWSLENDALTH